MPPTLLSRNSIRPGFRGVDVDGGHRDNVDAYESTVRARAYACAAPDCPTKSRAYAGDARHERVVLRQMRPRTARHERGTSRNIRMSRWSTPFGTAIKNATDVGS